MAAYNSSFGNILSDPVVTPAGLENMFEELSQLPSDPLDFSKVAQICGNYGLSFI